jgi:hypothetical protein
MTERERLIELIHMGIEYARRQMQDEGVDFAYVDVADHLLANGVIVPPVAVGQPVWFIPPTAHKPMIAETEIDKVVLKRGGLYIKLAFNAMYETSCKSIGKTVFLTKEDAEKALKERQEK